MAKYAFVYMAQPLCKGVPAFCLACMGTNNKFTADLVLKRWLYLFSECKKRGITVASFGADGDSRELKAMQVSAQLLFKSPTPQSFITPSSSLQKLPIPSDWLSWFAVRKPTAVAYVQDIVHVAVKLKSRLVKPSIVLPLGKYLAGVHHLRLVQCTFGKDQHGLRERDIDHKDKQNYDAVMRMTSKACMELLSQIPDAKGTHAFLEVIRSVIDSFLDKELDAPTRVEKAWYAVFFMRYWRQWLLCNPHYTLGNNFITLNAYICIELNAHSLITFLMTVRDLLQSENQCFVPWVLGSQSCEKIFRAARSMSSTFSTVINFAMLGVLRRLHRLHIQLCLQTESQETSIKYPRTEAHKSKDGHQKASRCNVHSVTNEQIVEAVMKGRKKAQEKIEALGMAELLQKKKNWDNPPIPAYVQEEVCDEDDCEEEELAGDDHGHDDEAHPSHDPTEVASAISQLSSNGVIENDLTARLMALHRSSFQRITGPTLPMFEIDDGSSKGKMSKRKHSPYVAVQHAGKTLFINKTTAVWLLQEGERVSSDRLFRVRSRRPFTSNCQTVPGTVTPTGTTPFVCQTIQVGNICVFKDTVGKWKIGTILQFSNFQEKTKKSQQYSGRNVNLSGNVDKIGVLCSWWMPSSSEPIDQVTAMQGPSAESVPINKYTLAQYEGLHSYCPLTSYVCTLPHACFELIEGNQTQKSILASNQSSLSLATAQHLTLKASSVSYIEELLQNKADTEVITIDDDDNCDVNSKKPSRVQWVSQGSIVLYAKDRQDILSGKELNNLHVTAFQYLLKKQFQSVGGLQNTLLQQQSPLQAQEAGQMMLQVIHVRKSHWAALQISGSDISVYDSLYTSISKDTFEVIAQLVRCKDKTISVNVMNVAKQSGSTDCALFALASVTCLALGIDPVTVVYDQQQLRAHFVSTLESGHVTAYPVLKKRRPAARVHKVETCTVYCYCRMPDDGDMMVCCDKCDGWFHFKCLKIRPSDSTTWFCDKCAVT